METKIYEWPTQNGKILQIKGEVDLYSAPGLFTTITSIVEKGPSALHLDLSGVEYLDSSGVGTIIKTLQLVKNRGTAITFSGISGSPRKVLSMANILPLLREIPVPEELSELSFTH
ncbi:MAG TPA: STAS domain-containing protein [Termitinemataceae bacterium]|nr:STAS domain-containing protein [Termitinemataceae bacterium]HOM23359.1 STAS domain-containing protein [Termitinemataceae bacterium]HPQ00135.1 STAS domain-containing protein [Termitinemataceae bacterium]